MSKRPWMPFYVRDYIAKTDTLTLEEHGAYILLMCHYWNHASAPANASALHRLCRCMSSAEQDACDGVVVKFFTVEGDSLRHERLDEELAKVVQISEKRSKAAKVRYEKKAANAPANAVQMQTHSDSHSHTDKKKEPKTSSPKALPSEATELAKRLGRWIRERDPENKSLAEAKHVKTFTTWADAIDKLNRIDGREWAVIQAVVDWCQKDEFWKNNILSGTKLRGKFPALFLKMSQETPHQPLDDDDRDYREGF